MSAHCTTGKAGRAGAFWRSGLWLMTWLLGTSVQAQITIPFWQPLAAVEEGARSAQRFIRPTTATYLTLDHEGLRQRLATAAEGTVTDLRSASDIITLPGADGRPRSFRFLRTPVMHPDLQAQYPSIITCTGRDMADPSVVVKFDLTPLGFHAMMLGVAGGDVFIDPVFQGDNMVHQVYRRNDLPQRSGSAWTGCGVEEVNDMRLMEDRMAVMLAEADQRAGDCMFRTYRLALACTGEYAAFHGGTAQLALAAMNTTMNRVNGIFERDMTLTMQMVPNNNLLVFTNAVTDGFTDDDPYELIDENVVKCNAVIGSANYDIGHVFSTGGGGLAQLQSVCTSSKAAGVTGTSAPIGDAYDIDYVAHEMGHQFGGNHTQNNSCQRASAAAREVGSGITIMGYAGICAPNVANNSIAMFGAYTLQEMHAFVTSGPHTCPVKTSTGNAMPTAEAGANRSIPRGTPFILTGVATDADPTNLLTYTWEQMDNASATQPPTATNTGGPAFRPFLPETTPVRYMPALSAVIANTTPTWEVLSNVTRTYNFRFTVRDNAAGGGCNAQDNMTVSVTSAAGPFVVTAPNTAETWTAGSTRTVTWNVASTTAAPVSCSAVDILLSVDGGYTYPHVLATATANDGTQDVVMPNVNSTTARVMVRANANIFYDISNTNFTLSGAALSRLAAKVFLGGCYNTTTGLMRDDLRTAGLVPATEPYTALGFTGGGTGGETVASSVLAVTGANAIVDWVRVELRDPNAPGTVLYTRQALLQRDGDIVEVDGVSAVTFPVASGSFRVAVRHRNHLACMTAGNITLGPSTATLDLTSTATATYGTNARRTMGSVQTLWAGNTVRDNTLRYIGDGNDRDPVLQRIGGGVPTASFIGYWPEDANIDGVVRYLGDGNDRDLILEGIGGSVPTVVRTEQLP